jgi:hypothetical protein
MPSPAIKKQKPLEDRPQTGPCRHDVRVEVGSWSARNLRNMRSSIIETMRDDLLLPRRPELRPNPTQAPDSSLIRELLRVAVS